MHIKDSIQAHNRLNDAMEKWRMEESPRREKGGGGRIKIERLYLSRASTYTNLKEKQHKEH